MDTLVIEDFSSVVDEIYTTSALFREPIQVADPAVGILYTYMHAAQLSRATPLTKAACHYLAAELSNVTWAEASDYTFNYKARHEGSIDDRMAIIATTLEGQLIILTPVHFLRQYEIRGELPTDAWDKMRSLMRNERTYTYPPAYFADSLVTQLQAGKDFEWPAMMKSDEVSTSQLEDVKTTLSEATLLGEGAFGKVVSLKGFAYKESDNLSVALRELAVMRYCKHPNVLEVLGFGYKSDYNEKKK